MRLSGGGLAFTIGVLCTGAAACGACSKREAGRTETKDSARVVAEVLPRCRGGTERFTIPGEDVIVGDAAAGPGGLLVGVIRTIEGGKRVGSVLRASLDLASARMIDVGTAFGDDPPPSPRWNGAVAQVAHVVRRPSDGGPNLRDLRVLRLGDTALGSVDATVLQQADESTAFDVAWSGDGGGLVAWDEDAPSAPAGVQGAAERGVVKVQPLVEGARWRVASPERSDAEAPRLLARPSGGFWLAWLARRVEEEAYAVEGPGERRAFRWVESVELTARGEPAGPVRRVSPEDGRAASFELARRGADLVVLVQDEAAAAEGAGARIVKYVVTSGAEGVDIVDGGIDQALADLVPMGAGPDGARWLAWTDMAEHAHLLPLGGDLAVAGRATAEPALDGARVLAAAPPDVLYALLLGAGATAGDGPAAKGSGEPSSRVSELRRFVCSPDEARDE